jgi:putative zinc finger/helix-turn-helix YgiT family protein
MSVRNLEKREDQGQETLCPECGRPSLETVEVKETFDHGGRKKPIHVTALLPIKRCRDCHFSYEDWETEQARHRAACAQVGVQAPEEIRCLRKRYDLNQKEFARLTRLGGATLNRWERGHLIQNGAYDDYLYLLRFPENLERLRERRRLTEESHQGGQALAGWIYCVTAGQVNATSTQSLLRTHQGIWCPPPGLFPFPGTPQSGDRLWLVWREVAGVEPTLLLGGGRVLAAPRHLFGTDLLWTNPDLPGIRDEAQHLGYSVGNATSFLRLGPTVLPSGGTPVQVAGLGQLHAGLNVVTPDQERLLDGLLPIP